MSKKYDPKEAREEIYMPLEKRIINYAGKFGKSEEVAKRLANADYRTNAKDMAKDPVSILDEVCEEIEPESLEGKVTEEKAMVKYEERSAYADAVLGAKDLAAIVSEGTVNLLKKSRIYYPFLGALPGKYQEKIAEKLGENPLHYTYSNMVLETAIGLIGLIAGAFYNYAGIVIVTEFLMAEEIFRKIMVGLDGPGENSKKPVGSTLLMLPYLSYYFTLYAIRGISAAGKVVTKCRDTTKESYSSAYEKRKLKQAGKSKRETNHLRFLEAEKLSPLKPDNAASNGEMPEPRFAEEETEVIVRKDYGAEQAERIRL